MRLILRFLGMSIQVPDNPFCVHLLQGLKQSEKNHKAVYRSLSHLACNLLQLEHARCAWCRFGFACVGAGNDVFGV